MKRTEFVKYLRAQGCAFIRKGAQPVDIHGGGNPTQKKKRSSVPPHTEISDSLARKIWKDLEIEPIE